MSDLEALLARYVAALNARDLDALAELVAPVLLHNGERLTRAQWWDGPVGESLAAMPDFRWTVEEAVATGDRLVVRYRDTGTPVAEWQGHTPTGASVSFREYVFYTVHDGQIAVVWSVFDGTRIAAQLAGD